MPFEIELLPRFKKTARELDAGDFERLADAIERLQAEFGQPHLHSALGIRKIAAHYFEFRVGLKLRVVFRAERGRLALFLVGSHEDVQRFLRS